MSRSRMAIGGLTLLAFWLSSGCTSAKRSWDSAGKSDRLPTRDAVNDGSPAPGSAQLTPAVTAWVVTDDAGINHLYWTTPRQVVTETGGPLFWFVRSDTPIRPGDTVTGTLFVGMLWDPPPTVLDQRFGGPGYYAGRVSYRSDSAAEEITSDWVFFQMEYRPGRNARDL